MVSADAIIIEARITVILPHLARDNHANKIGQNRYLVNTVDPDRSECAVGRRSKVLDNWWIRTRLNDGNAPGG